MALCTGGLAPLIDSVLKGTGLLLVAAISVLFLGKASAAIRHLVWLLTLCALLALPIMSPLLPRWAVLPRLNIAVASSSPSFKAGIPSQSHLDRAAGVEVQLFPVSGAASVLPIASKRSFQIHYWLPLVWTTGFALLLVRLAAAQWFLGRAVKRCIVVRDGRLAEAKQDAWQQLNIRRPVQLLIDPRRTIPMAWGVFRPRVLLPAEAADWDESRLHAVLLHEMAHITRGDAVVQWLAQLSCALHWFNPLVWFAARQLRVETERACDDLVLTNGVRASDYAQHLLRLARTFSSARMTQALGSAMASHSGLEGRLLAVLNHRANRRRVTRASAFAALTLGLCVVIPVAMLRAAPENRLSDTAVDGQTETQKSTNEDQTITAAAADTDSPLPGTSTGTPPPARASGIITAGAGQILVEARFVETLPNERVPDEPSNVTNGKGTNGFYSSRTVTGVGEDAEIFVWKEQPATATPGATEFVRTGVNLRVTPRLKEDQIAYTVRLPRRALLHSEAKDAQTINETSPDELQVSNTAKDGEGTWFHIHQYRSDKMISVISVWLRFKRLG